MITIPGQDIREAFARAAKQNRAALVTYVTFGDPTIEASLQIVASLAQAGVDVIELGLPYSDPSADGPVIQRAMDRALQQGATLKKYFAGVEKLRAQGCDVPIVLFGYYNPMFIYGLNTLAQDLARAKIGAVLTVDVPVDELAELSVPLHEHNVGVVPLVAPTSTDARLQRLSRFSPAFVYYISMTGITGSSFQGAEGGAERIAQIRLSSQAPVAVGFGVRSAQDVKSIAGIADGVVVGSALIEAIEKAAVENAPSVAFDFAKGLIAGLGR